LVSGHSKSYYLQFVCYYYKFKILPNLSSIYKCITRWANRQVSSWAFAIRSPGILCLDAICNTFIIYNLCSDGQLCTVNVLHHSTLFVTAHYLQFFREAGTIFYLWDGVTYWHFLCSNTHLPYEGTVKYLQSLCCPCSMWNLIIIYISCTLTHQFSGNYYNYFRYFLLCLICLLTLSAKPY
jgi:hypothetical protein